MSDLFKEQGRGYEDPRKATSNLHLLAQEWHVLLEHVTDLQERLGFLSTALQRFRSSAKGLPASESLKVTVNDETSDKIHYLLSNCTISRRWVSNYRDRTNIRINLVRIVPKYWDAFHLSTQLDNETNVRISRLTSIIARDTQRDSSSMITIAALTMMFLPGTFVSAIFSMVFFNVEKDATGVEKFWVSRQWWYYLIVSIPLTAIVFAIWNAWQRKRFHGKEIEEPLALKGFSDKLLAEPR
ncbi:hypothetical protein MMC13_008084 [Lambiella insularis]|nr:hypothetical protein [Lambiella insularis]